MKIRFLTAAGLLLAGLLVAPASARAQSRLELKKGDHVVLVGNALADRMQHHGGLEALIHARFPDHQLVFRNISASGDEVATWHRSENFGSREDWLNRTKADVIVNACDPRLNRVQSLELAFDVADFLLDRS